MNKIMVIYAHPSPKKSKINRHLFETAKNLEHVTAHDLYELYPHMHIDVRVEQAAVRDAQTLVFQFPIYWYSAPSILKEWIDSVLTHEFAYGSGEKALAGKNFMLAISASGSVGCYSKAGPHGAEIGTYLAPFEQTARFCGMKLLDPFIVQKAGEIEAHMLDQIIDDYEKRLIKLGTLGDGG